MKSLSLLIKPISSSCQMSCTYCFYKDVAKHRSCADYGRMKEDVVQALLDRVFCAMDEEGVITFAFQGGEPLLAGLSFYEQFVNCVHQRKQLKQRVHYVIQTNGMMLDAAWCFFFHTHGFLVGVSLDGPKKLHDSFRKQNASGTYVQVMRSVQLLRRYHVAFNILSVVTQPLAKEPKKLYLFYKKHEFHHVQLIPCLAPLQETSSAYSLTPELFFRFYSSFFNLWLQDVKKKSYWSVALFDNLLLLLQGKQAVTCGMMGQCQFQYVVESDGSVYPCDFYVLDCYCCGNVKDTDLYTAGACVQAREFLLREEVPHCHTCPFEPMCHGSCKRLRSTFMDKQQCGYQRFLLHAYPKLKEVVDKNMIKVNG